MTLKNEKYIVFKIISLLLVGNEPPKFFFILFAISINEYVNFRLSHKT